MRTMQCNRESTEPHHEMRGKKKKTSPVLLIDALWLETCEFSLEGSHVRTKTCPVRLFENLWLETCEFSLESSHVRTKTCPVRLFDTL